MTDESRVRKPWIALFFATLCGLGYIRVAPRFFGSLAGVVLALSVYQMLANLGISGIQVAYLGGIAMDPLLVMQCLLAVMVAMIGVWSAGRASRYWQRKDDRRRVLIDEVSGQHLALVLGSALPVWWRQPTSWAPPALGFITYQSALSWKHLLLGLVLFCAFDIWKPFPARQAGLLRGGLGIMADDWVAGVYAALGVWLARGLGL